MKIAPILFLTSLFALGCSDMLELAQECPAVGVDSGCDDSPSGSGGAPLVCGVDPAEETLVCLASCASNSDCPSDKECTPVEGTDVMGCTTRPVAS